MKYLLELVDVVNRNKIKRIKLLDLRDDRGGKTNDLYRAIDSGKVTTDEEARDLLFPNAKSPSSLYNTKASLREKLLNTLFFIDVKEDKFSDRQRAYYQLQKDFAAAQLLTVRHAHTVAARELHRVLKRAIDFEIVDVTLAAARALRKHYSSIKGEEKLFQEMDDLCETYEEIDTLELHAESSYFRLIVKYVNGSIERKELKRIADSYWEELNRAGSRVETYGFRFYLLLIDLFRRTIFNDYGSCIEICEEAIEFFRSKPYEARTPLETCFHHQLVAYLQRGDYERGVAVGQQSRSLVEPGSFNWFRDREYLFLLAMHAGHYQDAYDYYREATDHSQFPESNDSVREIWILYRAYLQLLVDNKLVRRAEDDAEFAKFRMQRFVNNLPKAERDKRGLNLAILVIQIVFLLKEKRYDAVIDRSEAVRKYLSRHELRKKDTQRSYLFIQLLLTVADNSFDRRAVEQDSADLRQQLREESRATANPFHKIEIIPYEELWEMVLEALE